ncbi:MAG: choice-of-anchor X domain-containing protein [Candidatus Eisenbacteria bacterium]
MKRYFTGAALFLAVLTGLSGCLGNMEVPGHSNPLDPSNPNTASVEPDRPRGLTAVISDRLVELSWSVGDASAIEHYRVYRWEVEDEDDEDYELLDTTTEMEYADGDVKNGQGYYYKVSGVNGLGLEGVASREIVVIPRVFGVAINQGSPKTSSRSVTLRMSASTGTDIMQVSNAADMSDAQWEPYQSSRSWSLEAGDGVKTVYARFRDSADNESAVVSDTIELDTRAVIESVTEDSDGEDLSTGDVIHFTLTTGELYGDAAVDVGSVVPGITLYDDGTGGDAVPNDGVYERDYTIDQGVEVINGPVTGTFRDEAGNQAEPVLADGTVTILDPPAAVVMGAPVPLSESRIALSWSRNNDSDFSVYKLYRSYVPGVDESTQRELIGNFSDQSSTDHTDTGLEPDSAYYYAVYVVDRAGLTSISNEVAAATLVNLPPDPVVLYSPWAASSTSLELSWSVSDAEDFVYYELIGWVQDPPSPPATSEKRVITRIETRRETFYTHESLDASMVYWYEVAVIDSFGAEVLSNTVSGSPAP